MTPRTKRALALAALAAGGVAGAAGVVWVLDRGADPVYLDDAALAGWAHRLAHPPSSVDVPVDVALPETSTGQPLRQGVPLSVDRSLNVADPGSLVDAANVALVATTSDLLLTVSKQMLQIERREVLPIPADPTRGFDAKYKHSEGDFELLAGAVAPLAYVRDRAWTLRKKLGQWPARESLLVLVDRDLPCRLLAEVFLAVGALDFMPHLMGARAGRVVDMGLSADFALDWESGAPRIVTRPESGSEIVRVAVLPQTFELGLPHERGGMIECTGGRVELRDGARLITITRRGDEHDFEALSDCARRVENALSLELAYGVAPAAAVDVRSLVSAVDALRKDAPRDVEIGLDLSAFFRGPAP